MLTDLQPPESDLAAPITLREASMVLREIMQVYDSALLENESAEQRAEGFKEVLDGNVQPMIEMCTTMGSLMKPDKGQEAMVWDRAIFMINCLLYLEVGVPLDLC
jgi:hypothetical protein